MLKSSGFESIGDLKDVYSIQAKEKVEVTEETDGEDITIENQE